ncbi:hypothetical protein LRP88_05605 [Fusarium phalaenopsidis]|nr:NYN domain-containing protein [Fusarium sp. Ph1]
MTKMPLLDPPPANEDVGDSSVSQGPPAPPPDEIKRNIYIYIDYSNFWWHKTKLPRGDTWNYDVKHLRDLLIGGTQAARTGSYECQINVCGYVPKDIKDACEGLEATVQTIPGVWKEKEVDTSLVADSVAKATRAFYKEPKGTGIEFVIVSGDLDMRPAAEKIALCGFSVQVWSWEGALAPELWDLQEEKPDLFKVYLLDDYEGKFFKKPFRKLQEDWRRKVADKATEVSQG